MEMRNSIEEMGVKPELKRRMALWKRLPKSLALERTSISQRKSAEPGSCLLLLFPNIAGNGK